MLPRVHSAREPPSWVLASHIQPSEGTSLGKTQGREVVSGTLEEVPKQRSSFLNLLALNDCEHRIISVQSPG